VSLALTIVAIIVMLGVALIGTSVAVLRRRRLAVKRAAEAIQRRLEDDRG
jgi:hypothetical protein